MKVMTNTKTESETKGMEEDVMRLPGNHDGGSAMLYGGNDKYDIKIGNRKRSNILQTGGGWWTTTGLVGDFAAEGLHVPRSETLNLRMI